MEIPEKESMFSPTGADNTRRDNAAVFMSVGVNAPLECWGCTNYPIYHMDMLHAYINCPKKMGPYIAECKK